MILQKITHSRASTTIRNLLLKPMITAAALTALVLTSCNPKTNENNYRQTIDTYNSSLSAYWKMDETGGARSSAVYVMTMTAGNGPTSATGLLGLASKFEAASSQYLKIDGATATGLQFTSRFAVSAWVKPSSVAGSTSRVIFNKLNASGQDVVTLSYTQSNIYANIRQANGTITTIGAIYTFAVDQWVHVFLSGNGQTLKLYINGSSVDLGSAYADIDSTTGDAYIGAGKSSERFFDGLIDEVAVWKNPDFPNTMVLDELALALYNEGKGLSAN
ncbi:MAG: LamG domain-containing protein [Pseudobdellovibrionaceae bacterium]